ncbi:N-acetyltransferase [Paenibacillus sp. BR2-3]|uniref:N-acetyltransferase n=1 Tax=Paenibacillus sp. BR2-3 TaxID=3048494 RepID=UPI003977A457
MQISSLYDTESGPWNRHLADLLQFIRHYGERRITMDSCRRLARLTPELLGQPGVSLLVATVRGQYGRQLSGVSFVSGFGKESCLVAVHPLYRNKHTGTALLAAQLQRLGCLECSVASDNAASLKMCFNAGLVAVALNSGPTGKPTLLLQSSQHNGFGSTRPVNQTEQSAEPNTSQEGDLLCRNPS